MAILDVEDLADAPTTGNFNPINHGSLLATQPANTGTNQAGRIYYDEGYTEGFSALRFDGEAGFCWLQIPLSQPHVRLRFYAKKSGTQSNHHFILYPSGGDNDSAASAVGAGYDVQIRNIAGSPIWNRYNFSNVGASANWSDDTWWRIEYEFINESHPDLDNGGVETGDGATRTTGGGLLEIWYNPEDSGPPDYSTWAAGAGDATRLLIGNSNQTSGVQLFAAHLALSDGARIGPWVPGQNPIQILTPVRLSATSAQVRWVDVPDAPDGYTVARKLGVQTGDPAPEDIIATGVEGSPYVDETLDDNGAWTYWVARTAPAE